MPNTCTSCQYFYAAVGECHRFPPTVLQGSKVEMIWSLVRAEDWCGEYTLGAAPGSGITITSLAPSSLPAGSTPATVTVNGAGFDSSCTILADGQSRATFYISTTELQYTARPDLEVSGNTHQITVENGTGDVSNALTFTFT